MSHNSLDQNASDYPRVTKETIIEVRSVSKFFIVKSQSVEILKGIDLTIRKGEFMALFGPSGCGKSTLLHIVLGLEKPNTGLVLCKGQELYLLSEDDRAKLRKKTMGMIYQQSNWIKSLSVIENVAFMGSLLGYSRPQAMAMAREQLQNVGMLEWADYRPTELSSGQQQKVSLARALLNDPDIIIADEPTGNLDYRSGVELMKQFSALAAEGKTILMVTHNIDNVDYTTQVIQMFDGKLVGVNKTKEEDIKALKSQIIENISQAQSKSQSDIQNGKSAIQTVVSKNSVITVKKKFPTLHINLTKPLREFAYEIVHLFKFSGYLFYFFISRGVDVVQSKIHRLIRRAEPQRAQENREIHALSSIHPSDLIEIALKNMFAKKTRTIVTIGGMAIGICLIVFLISIGYGVEQLVISRVARLEETKQTDIAPVASSNILLTEKSISDIRALPNVVKVLPVIGVVGKVRNKSATTDVAVYGVSPDYLKESAIRPAYGEVFGIALANDTGNGSKTNTVSTDTARMNAPSSLNEGTAPVMGGVVRAIAYEGSDSYVRVRERPDSKSRIVGYTKVATGSGSLVWGSTYEDDKTYGSVQPKNSDEPLGFWIQDDFLLWQERDCGTECTANSMYQPSEDVRGNQKTKQGYIAINGLITDFDPTKEENTTFLAANSTPTPPVEATDQASLVEKQLKELTLVATQTNTKQIDLPKDTKRYAYVNTTLLDVIGLDPKKATGSKIELALVATDSTLNHKVETNYLEYTIIGVTSESKTPILYTRIEDTLALGLPYYSQAKIVVSSREKLAHLREQIGALGFKTSSVVDTIAQIEKLFASIRTLLGVLGVVALSVAALGMFNTLTVSMLERTHEVGMMKAVGMVSKEVKELFLAESMIMGILGGIVGLILGILAGRLLSLALSFVSISKGAGFMSVSSLPLDFIVLIVVLSLIVGFVTGMYPASRATRISALDALRYE